MAPRIRLEADSIGEWALVLLGYGIKALFRGIKNHPFVSIPVILTITALIATSNLHIIWQTIGTFFAILGAILGFLGWIGFILLFVGILAFIGFDGMGQVKDLFYKGYRKYKKSKYGSWDIPIPESLAKVRVSPTARGYWLRSHWDKACKRADLTGNREFRGTSPKLIDVKPMPYGLYGQVNMTDTGKTAEYFAEHAERLSSALGRVKVVARPVSANLVDAKFYWHDPLSDFMNDVEMDDDKSRITYGISEDGQPVTLSPFFSTLIFGRTGSGKSTVVWRALKGLLDNGVPFVVTVIDPKSGMEYRKLKHGAFSYTDRPDGFKAILEKANENMVSRERWLASQGLDKLEHIDDKNPLHFIIIDEMIEVINKDTSPLIRSILNRGRATGFVIWGLSQASQKDVLGQIRDYFTQRISLASPSSEMTDAALGNSATKRGALAHQIKIPGEEGLGYELNESALVPTRFRTLFVDAAQKEITADRIAAMLDIIRSTWTPGERTGLVYKWFTEREANKLPSERDYKDGYIGKTIRGAARFQEHVDTKDWIRRMAGADIEHFDTECATLKREAELIFKHKPQHNTQGKNKLMEPQC